MLHRVAISLLFAAICSPTLPLAQNMCSVSETGPAEHCNNPDTDTLTDRTMLLQLPVATVSGAARALTLLNAGSYDKKKSEHGGAQQLQLSNCQTFKCNQVHCAENHPTNMAPDELPQGPAGEVVKDVNPVQVPAAPEWTGLGGTAEALFCKEKYDGHEQKVCWRIRARKVDAVFDNFTPKDVCESCMCRPFQEQTRVKLKVDEDPLTANSEGTIQPRPVSTGPKDVKVRWDGHPPTVQSVPAEAIEHIHLDLGQPLSCDKHTYTIGEVIGSGSKAADAVAYRATWNDQQFVWKKFAKPQEVKALELLEGATNINQLVDLCNAGGMMLSMFQGTPANTWDELRQMPNDRKQTVLDKLVSVSEEILSKGVVDFDRSPIVEEQQGEQSHNTLIDANTGAVMAIDFDLSEFASVFVEEETPPAAAKFYKATVFNTVFSYTQQLDAGTAACNWAKKGIAAVEHKFTSVGDDIIRAAATLAIIQGAITTRDPHVLRVILANAEAGDLLRNSENKAFDMAQVLEEMLYFADRRDFAEQVDVLIGKGAVISQRDLLKAVEGERHEILQVYVKHLGDEKAKHWLVELFKTKCDRSTGPICNPSMLSVTLEELGRLQYDVKPLFTDNEGRFTKSLCSAMFPKDGAKIPYGWPRNPDERHTTRAKILASMRSLGDARTTFLHSCHDWCSGDVANEEEIQAILGSLE